MPPDDRARSPGQAGHTFESTSERWLLGRIIGAHGRPCAATTTNTGQGAPCAGELTLLDLAQWNVCRLDTHTSSAFVNISWSTRWTESYVDDGPLLASPLTLTLTIAFAVTFEVAVTVSCVA